MPRYATNFFTKKNASKQVRKNPSTANNIRHNSIVLSTLITFINTIPEIITSAIIGIRMAIYFVCFNVLRSLTRCY